MTTITGTKVINNVALLGSALDANKDGHIVGNKKNTSVGSTQKWTISKGSKKDSFIIKNDHLEKYLGYEGPDPKHLTPVLSTEQQLWEIVEIHGHYKLEVYDIGVVCSLQSSDANYPVVLRNFLGQYEEWTLEDVKKDPPTPDVIGPKRILSVAFNDRAFDNNATIVRATSLHKPPHTPCTQRYTITKVDDAYLLKNDYGAYLSLDAGKKNPISSNAKQLWDIVPINGHYKLQAHKLDIVCSLQSGTDGAEVLMAKYQGKTEEWILENYPNVPTAAGGCRCGSRA